MDEKTNVPEPANEQITDQEGKTDTPETENQDSPVTEEYSYSSEPQPKKPKRKISKRTVLEIIGGILLAYFMVASTGAISQEEYAKLQEDYEDTKTELEETKTSLEEISNEYGVYKSKMDKYSIFDGFTSEEIDAVIAEAEEKVAEQKAAEEQAAAEEEARQEAIASASLEQLNALSSAASYLDYTSFSYSGLIDQLEFEGYSTEAATYAADNCGADWNEQAALKAQSYLDYTSFSRQGLIDQLIFEGFTQEQAEYGVSAVGY